MLPKGTIAAVVSATSAYAWSLVVGGEYAHCLCVIKWGREILKRRWERAKEMEDEYDGKIQPQVRSKVWDDEGEGKKAGGGR